MRPPTSKKREEEKKKKHKGKDGNKLKLRYIHRDWSYVVQLSAHITVGTNDDPLGLLYIRAALKSTGFQAFGKKEKKRFLLFFYGFLQIKNC